MMKSALILTVVVVILMMQLCGSVAGDCTPDQIAEDRTEISLLEVALSRLILELQSKCFPEDANKAVAPIATFWQK